MLHDCWAFFWRGPLEYVKLHWRGLETGFVNPCFPSVGVKTFLVTLKHTFLLKSWILFSEEGNVATSNWSHFNRHIWSKIAWYCVKKNGLYEIKPGGKMFNTLCDSLPPKEASLCWVNLVLDEDLFPLLFVCLFYALFGILKVFPKYMYIFHFKINQKLY